MVLCPAPTCSKVFTSSRGLQTHIGKSISCAKWMERLGQALPLYDTDDVENWPTIQSEPVGDIHADNSMTNEWTAEDSIVEPASPPLLPVNPSPELNGTTYRYRHYPFTPYNRTYGKGEIPYEVTRAAEIDPENITFPFAGADEWTLAKWLSSSGLSATQVDEFLKLSWVSLTHL